MSPITHILLWTVITTLEVLGSTAKSKSTPDCLPRLPHSTGGAWEGTEGDFQDTFLFG